MAEKIVSPGVFTQENDYSFLPIGIGQIGAAIIGPTVKGPAFVPTIIESQQDYDKVFGGTSEYMYTPYTIKNYLKYAGRVTVVRVLNSEGYQVKVPSISATATTIFTGSFVSASVIFTFTSSVNYIFSSSINITLGSSVQQTAIVLAPTSETVTTLTAAAGAETTSGLILALTSSEGVSASFTCSYDTTSNNYFTKVFGTDPWGSQLAYCYNAFESVGLVDQSATLSATSPSYISTDGIDPAFITAADEAGLRVTSAEGEFIKLTTGSYVTTYSSVVDNDTYIDFSTDLTKDYSEASTPWIISQKVGGTTTKNLFKVITLSHGNTANYEYKIAISDIKPAGTIPGSDYGTFTLTVRGVYGKFGSYDTDKKPDVKEIYTNLTLDPSQPNFIGKAIGTRWYTFTTDQDGKIVSNGDYPNISKYIRIELDSDVAKGTASPELVPFGFEALNEPVAGVSYYPSASFVSNQTINDEYNQRVHWGFDYEDNDNLNYLSAIPSGSTDGNNIDFNLENFASSKHPTYTSSIAVSATCPIELKKFVVPFQGGFDGVNPAKRKSMGADMTNGNSFGFNFAKGTNSGSMAYKKAIDTISNGEEFDINMLVMPGVLYTLAPTVCDYAIEMINNRNDVFYVMDSAQINDNVAKVTNIVANLDDNYTATYYPWVKIFDSNLNKTVWVPPSVVLPGVIAYNDKVGYEWYAPAGLNRGGLTNVLETRTRLTHSERDDLYLGRVNPIATFPGQGVTVWGQKTLQVRPSALDRINVRRLLIAIKKYIASATRYLVFEQNVTSTRNRFLAICNPYLESIQQRAGLYAFKVVMDETNNPPDLIDRNMMKGEIWLKPTKTAEMIVIDFNIMPTGASFGA